VSDALEKKGDIMHKLSQENNITFIIYTFARGRPNRSSLFRNLPSQDHFFFIKIQSIYLLILNSLKKSEK